MQLIYIQEDGVWAYPEDVSTTEWYTPLLVPDDLTEEEINTYLKEHV